MFIYDNQINDIKFEISDDEKLHWFRISKIRGLDYQRIHKLICFFGNEQEFLFAKITDLKKAAMQLGFIDSLQNNLTAGYSREQIQEEYHALSKQQISFIIRRDSAYPKRIRQIEAAPYYLYYSGHLPEDRSPSLAIIGARNCTGYGKELTVCFSSIFAEAGIQIISGMANGIDSHAHRGALSVQGYTCAVLGFGLDQCYPKEHYYLKNSIKETGGLVSEYSQGTPGLKLNFPARNRLISALADGVLVVEAAGKSGTMITVDAALDQGRNIYVIPGRIGDPLSEGCNNLLKHGAKVVTEPMDIFEDYGIIQANANRNEKEKKSKIVLETEEQIVYANLDLYPKHIEELLILTRFSLEKLTEILFDLEQKNYIAQTVKNYYSISYRASES